MIKGNHIDHADLMQLGRMLLLLSERQHHTMDVSSLTEVNKKVCLVKDLPKAS